MMPVESQTGFFWSQKPQEWLSKDFLCFPPLITSQTLKIWLCSSTSKSLFSVLCYNRAQICTHIAQLQLHPYTKILFTTPIYISWQMLWLLGSYSNETFGRKIYFSLKMWVGFFFRPSCIQLLQAQTGYSLMESLGNWAESNGWADGQWIKSFIFHYWAAPHLG